VVEPLATAAEDSLSCRECFKSGDAADQLLAARSTSHQYDQSDLFTMREKLANETKVKALVSMGAISALA
jgi:hypothetical protein